MVGLRFFFKYVFIFNNLGAFKVHYVNVYIMLNFTDCLTVLPYEGKAF